MEEKEFNYINVIPFIDIMLVLLTIVLTTSTFIAQGAIHIRLPQASHDEVETLKTLCIEIDQQGLIYLNSRLTRLERLCDGINSVSRETPVLIRADRRIALQVFVEVMDVVKNLGFKKVSLQTESRT
jgi:biopolymer transport protein ExbD